MQWFLWVYRAKKAVFQVCFLFVRNEVVKSMLKILFVQTIYSIYRLSVVL